MPGISVAGERPAKRVFPVPEPESILNDGGKWREAGFGGAGGQRLDTVVALVPRACGRFASNWQADVLKGEEK